MIDLRARLAGVSVAVVSPVDLMGTYERLRGRGVAPLFELAPGDDAPDATVVHVDRPGAAVVTVDPGMTRLEIACPRERLGDGTGLLYAIESAVERCLQLSGALTLVAASVALPSDDDGRRGVLLLGVPGAGKTSVAVDLCLRWGGRLVAGDTCVLALDGDHVTAGPGTLVIGVRYVAGRRYLPAFAERLSPPPGAQEWDKRMFRPGELGVRSADEPVPIVSTCLLRVDERADLQVTRPDPATLRIAVYENATRIIRGTATPLLAGDGTGFAADVPSLDSFSCYRHRTRLIETLLRRAPPQLVSGPLEHVSEWVARSCAKNLPS